MTRKLFFRPYPVAGQGGERDLPRFPALVLLLVLLALYALICLYGAWKGFTGDFDTGTVELMAVNIARGADFPLFWYGLHYAGALEAYVAAAMIRLFGFSELTLTLSPILFSLLWLAGTYLLFTEILGRRAGLVATLAAVFSGYYAWYYSYALSGGYSVILALGTLILWLGVRVWTGNPDPARLLPHVLAIGLLSALAIWVHFFILPYLLATAVCLLAHWIRRRFDIRILALYAAGALLATCGLVPFLIANNGSLSGSSISSFVPSLHHLRRSLDVLVHRDLGAYLTWKGDLPFDPARIHTLYLVLCLFLAGCTLVVVVRWRNRRPLLPLLAPLLYLLFFTAMFLPHRMAVIPAPRYLFGPWAMLLSTMWAYSFTLLCRPGAAACLPRLLFAGLLLFWIGYNGLGDYFFARSMARVKQQRLREAGATLDMVRGAGLKAVFLLGNEKYGYEGQKLSALTGNRIRFVHTGRERYQKNAQAVEIEPAYGFLCRAWDRERVTAALAPLRVEYQSRIADGSFLSYGFRIRGGPGREIGPDGITVRLAGQSRGGPGDLLDRDISTAAQWPSGTAGSVEIDLGRERSVSGFWLFAPMGRSEGTMQGLPRSYQVQGAGPDRVFRPLLSFASRVNEAYVQGGRVYVSGYFGRAECRIRPRSLRYLKITPGGDSEVRLAEIVLFEEAGLRPDMSRDAVRVVSLLQREQARFTFADRWLSALIIEALGTRSGRLPALPRFNPRADDQDYSRLVVPGPGLVLVSAGRVADDCERQLLRVYGAQAIRRRVDLGGYSLFFLARAARKPGQGFLYWNGHLLVRLQDFHDLAKVRIDGSGIPFLDPGRGRTSGFYHDGWTNGRGVFRDLDLRLAGPEHILVLVTGGNTPHGGDPRALGLQVQADGRRLRFLRRQGKSYLFALPQDLEQIEELQITSRTFVPGTRDNRILGMDVVRVLFL